MKPTTHQFHSHVRRKERPRSIKFDLVAVFLDAAAEGDLEEVQRLMDSDHIHVDICTERGVTALHRAAAFGQTDAIRLLLDARARINVTDVDEWTPLHNAVVSGSIECVKLLLAHGANVEARTADADFPSSLAESLDIIEALDKAKAQKYSSGYVTALYTFDKGSAEGAQGDELEFKEGDRLRILNRDHPDWWLAETNGQQGYIPRILVQ